jgi:hypothetical protein
MVVIEGSILNVMETWPLQLTVAVGGQRLQVSLTEQTEITAAGRPAGAGELRPGLAVAVQGHRADGRDGIVASRIVVRGSGAWRT